MSVSKRVSVLLTLISLFNGALSQIGFAVRASKKPIHFVLVKDSNEGDERCLKPRDPCLIPLNKGLTTTHYTASIASGNPNAVSLTFEEKIGREISDLMNANVGQRIAIVFDGNVIYAPVVRTAITGNKFEISDKHLEGNLTLKELLGVQSK